MERRPPEKDSHEGSNNHETCGYRFDASKGQTTRDSESSPEAKVDQDIEKSCDTNIDRHDKTARTINLVAREKKVATLEKSRDTQVSHITQTGRDRGKDRNP